MPQKYDAMEANKQEDPGSKTEKKRSHQTPLKEEDGTEQETKSNNCNMNADDQKEKPTLTNKEQTRLSLNGPRR